MSAALWKSVRALALEWAATGVFAKFQSCLPRNHAPPFGGLTAFLQSLDAGGLRIGARPLRAHQSLPHLLQSSTPSVAAELQSCRAEFLDWSKALQAVTEAHYDTIAWVRARLPGYPSLWPPHLVPGTPWMTDEFTWFLRWRPGERSLGFQSQDGPRNAPSLLGATPDQKKGLRERASMLAEALLQTEAWRRFAQATSDLDDQARDELKQGRRSLAHRLAPEAVDAHERSLALPRHAYREEVVREHVQCLTGAAREYAEAFDAANELIEHAASDVFGQLAAYGDPGVIDGCAELTLRPGEVSFVSRAMRVLEGGAIVWIDDLLVTDAVQLRDLHIHYDAATGMVQRANARLLVESSAAWRVPVALPRS